MSKTKQRNPNAVYELVTNQVIEMLEAGTVPWHRPWDASIGLPLSMSTRKPYRGINPFVLGITAQLKSFTSPWWGTYDQITARGGQVRKGEESTIVTFWKRGSKDVTDENTGETTEKRWAILRYFRVFNADQADGLEIATPGAREHEPIIECEQTMARYLLTAGPRITFTNDGAWYDRQADQVNVPPLGSFETPEAYYSAAFHELTHSTGHTSRLAREGVTEAHRFGDPVYSREELVAEMGAAMLAGTCGIEQVTIPQSAAYLANWLSALRGDSQMVVSAAAAAQRAADLILGVTHEVEQPVEQPQAA